MAERCRELREALDEPQREMAKRFNITLRAWQFWEAGKYQPRGYAVLLLEDLEEKLKQKKKKAA